MRKLASLGVVGLLVGVSCSVARAQQAFTLPKPTAQHAVLKQDAGVWDAEVVMWQPGSNATPVRSTGVERNRVIGAGMWLIGDFEGTAGGVKIVGHSVSGYDPRTKKYVGTWVDSLSPWMMTLEGTYDAKTKTMTMFSETRDPNTGTLAKGKSVTQYRDDGSRLFTMYMAAPAGRGKYVKVMQITYHRRPGAE